MFLAGMSGEGCGRQLPLKGVGWQEEEGRERGEGEESFGEGRRGEKDGMPPLLKGRVREEA